MPILQCGCTAVMEASWAGHLDVLQLLLSCGANINSTTTVRSIELKRLYTQWRLYTSTMSNSFNVCCASTLSIEQNGRTPVMEASLNGHAKVVRMLLNCSGGAYVNFFDNVSHVNSSGLNLPHVIASSRCDNAYSGKGDHPISLIAFALCHT